MADTQFYLSRAQARRLAKSYRHTEDGSLQEAPISILYGLAPTDHDRFPAANGGLFSTAADYVRFCQMLLNRGVYGRRRILTERAVAQMTSVQSGDLVAGFTPGNGWGVGVCIVRQPQGVTASVSPGTYGHGGAFGTQAWIDPVKGLITILMVQRANFPNSDASEVRKVFQEVAGALN
jgi:CubicO group peptidase (beta-lactamase class C family)